MPHVRERVRGDCLDFPLANQSGNDAGAGCPMALSSPHAGGGIVSGAGYQMVKTISLMVRSQSSRVARTSELGKSICISIIAEHTQHAITVTRLRISPRHAALNTQAQRGEPASFIALIGLRNVDERTRWIVKSDRDTPHWSGAIENPRHTSQTRMVDKYGVATNRRV